MSATAKQNSNVRDNVTASDPEVRARIASNPDTAPEVLYFLADDADVSVRRAIAINPNTPRQADGILARDTDYGVRCELARKIVGQGLGDDERSQLWRMGFTILETLATDSVVRVRRALAESLKGLVGAPRPIVTRLARDPEPEVATPLLQHSPVLTDDDLAGIVQGGAPDWAVSAVSRREDIGPRLAEAIAADGAVPAITGMLGNKRARIPDPTIETLAEKSLAVEDWREPLVNRPDLPGGAVLRLARFVSGPMLSILKGRDNLDPETRKNLERIVEARGDPQAKSDGRKAAGTPGWARGTAAEHSAQSWGGPQDRVLQLHQSGKLTDEVVEISLDSGDTEFITAALAIRSRLPIPVVERILGSNSPKVITALCWRAGFKMRFAIDVQTRIAQIQPGMLLYARDGFDYPLSPEDMTELLGRVAG